MGLLYFESAIRDAVDHDFIGQTDPGEEALSFRAAVEGLLARARILNDPDELSALTELPANILRLKPLGNSNAPLGRQEFEEPNHSGRELQAMNLNATSVKTTAC